MRRKYDLIDEKERHVLTGILAGKPITYAEFCRLVPVELVDSRSDRPETIAETRINTGAAEAKNEILDLYHGGGVSGRLEGLKRKGGRPRKWGSEAERKRSYRAMRGQTGNELHVN